MKKIFSMLGVFLLITALSACHPAIADKNQESIPNTDETTTVTETTVATRPYEYDDGFVKVTYDDLEMLTSKDNFTDVCVQGRIVEISKANDILILDPVGGKWTVDLGTDRNFASYIGTQCTVYGFSSGEISSQYDTPLINMDHADNHIVFEDAKTLYPKDSASWDDFEIKNYEDHTDDGEFYVWIPTNGGKKYHSIKGCSGMDNPRQVPEQEAVDLGYSRCSRCW